MNVINFKIYYLLKVSFLSTVLFIAGLNPAIAQESIPEMNDKALEFLNPDLFRVNITNNNLQLNYSASRSIYGKPVSSIMEEQLMNTNNKDILSHVAKAGKNRKAEFIAFAALPLGVIAAGFIRQNQSAGFAKPIGIALVAGSLSCIIVSPIACSRKHKNYKEAIRIYNSRF